MAKQVQQRRGTTVEHNSFTGAVGEITVDTSKDTAVVHDGSTVGGHPLALEKNVPNGSNSSITDDGTNVTLSGNINGVDASDLTSKTYVDNKPSGFKNLIINGGFDVSQRGDYTTATTMVNGAYHLDRWKNYNPTKTGNIQHTTNTVDGKSVKCLKYTTTQSGGGELLIEQRIEVDAIKAGTTVTLSAWVKSNSSTVAVRALNGASWVTGEYHSGNGNWEQLTLTFTTVYNSSYSAISQIFSFNMADTGYAEVTMVQLEEGSVATPFEQRPYGLELSLCQRYYYKKYTNTVYGAVGNLNHKIDYIPHPVEMRITPTQSIISSAVANGTTYLSVVDNEGTRIGVLSGSGGTSYNITYEADSEL